jgi:protein-disulfide isomerase
MSTALLLVAALLAAPGPGTPMAQIGPRTVKLAEVDKAAADTLKAAQATYEQSVYDARKAALDAMIDDALLEAEAKRRGLKDRDALRAAVAREVAQPSDADVSGFFQANQARLQGATLEEIGPQIREHLHQQAVEARQAALVASLREAAKVRVLFSPPRVQVEAKGPALGEAKAAVTVVMFGDFQCPYCARGAEALEEVRKRHPKDVRVVHRDYPLPFHQEAVPAAVAARCAARQGKYWEAHDALYAQFDRLSAETYTEVARTLSLNASAFEACRKDPTVRAEIDADAKAGAAAGVEGTPAFFINGIRIAGALPADQLDALVVEELGRVRGGKAK